MSFNILRLSNSLQINNNRREDKQPENKSLPSSTDEGFEDSRSGDFTKSPPMLQNSDKKIVSDSVIICYNLKLQDFIYFIYSRKKDLSPGDKC